MTNKCMMIIREVLVEAHRLRGSLARGEDDYLACLGIEKYLSREVLSEMTSRKQAHTNTILASQSVHDHKILSREKLSVGHR